MNILFSLIKGAPSLFIIALLLGILSHLRNKSTKSFEKSKQDFWDREQSANAVRKKDISNLPYVKIPDEVLAIARSYAESSDTDPDKSKYEAALTDLSDKKILNLNGKSNTDIKLEYGTANITVLSAADNNYTDLISVLSRLGASLYESGQYDKARYVLEYSVDIESDVLKSFQLLTDIYESTMSQADADAAKDKLHEKVEKLDSIRKNAILRLFEPSDQSSDETDETNKTDDVAGSD